MVALGGGADGEGVGWCVVGRHFGEVKSRFSQEAKKMCRCDIVVGCVLYECGVCDGSTRLVKIKCSCVRVCLGVAKVIQRCMSLGVICVLGEWRRLPGDDCEDELEGWKEGKEKLDQHRSQRAFLYFFEDLQGTPSRDLEDRPSSLDSLSRSHLSRTPLEK